MMRCELSNRAKRILAFVFDYSNHFKYLSTSSMRIVEGDVAKGVSSTGYIREFQNRLLKCVIGNETPGIPNNVFSFLITHVSLHE